MRTSVTFSSKNESSLAHLVGTGETWFKRVEMCAAVYAVAFLGLGLGILARIYPTRPDGTVLTIADVPSALRPVAYALFALLIWASIRICMRLIPHIFHQATSWWVRVLWFCAVILLLPVGPLIYYLAVFRKSDEPRGTGPLP